MREKHMSKIMFYISGLWFGYFVFIFKKLVENASTIKYIDGLLLTGPTLWLAIYFLILGIFYYSFRFKTGINILSLIIFLILGVLFTIISAGMFSQDLQNAKKDPEIINFILTELKNPKNCSFKIIAEGSVAPAQKR